jgi:hypothetical protein
VIVRFVDIGGIAAHHRLNFLLIIARFFFNKVTFQVKKSDNDNLSIYLLISTIVS